MAKKDKIKLKVNGDKFSEFIGKLSDLTDIGNIVKLKMDRDNILIYSLVGETAVLAFKSYLLNTSDYFEFEDFEFTLDYVINDAKKFVKKFGFLNTSSLELEISFKDAPEDENIKHVRAITANDGILKLAAVGAEQFKIRDMSKDRLAKTLDLNNSKWSFNVHKDSFTQVKKLSAIGDDKILNINIDDNQVKFSELGNWEMCVSTIDGSKKYNNLVFGKKYLKSVNLNDDYVSFNIFETFILIKDNESNFMMSFEQNFQDDDTE
jgi:hypothetical protein